MTPLVAGMMFAEKLGVPLSALMPLAKFQSLKAENVTLDVFMELASALGFDTPDESGLSGLVQKIANEKPRDLIAFMSTEENVVELVKAIRGEELPTVWKCPHCNLLSLQ